MGVSSHILVDVSAYIVVENVRFLTVVPRFRYV
jgi:hypothetical protein